MVRRSTASPFTKIRRGRRRTVSEVSHTATPNNNDDGRGDKSSTEGNQATAADVATLLAPMLDKLLMHRLTELRQGAEASTDIGGLKPLDVMERPFSAGLPTGNWSGKSAEGSEDRVRPEGLIEQINRRMTAMRTTLQTALAKFELQWEEGNDRPVADRKAERQLSSIIELQQNLENLETAITYLVAFCNRI